MKTLNLIALLLFIAACVAVFMLDTPTTRTVQSKVMAIFAPFMHASATVENTTSRAIAEDIDPKELMRETEALRLKVQKLTILSQRHDELLEEQQAAQHDRLPRALAVQGPDRLPCDQALCRYLVEHF